MRNASDRKAAAQVFGLHVHSAIGTTPVWVHHPVCDHSYRSSSTFFPRQSALAYTSLPPCCQSRAHLCRLGLQASHQKQTTLSNISSSLRSAPFGTRGFLIPSDYSRCLLLAQPMPLCLLKGIPVRNYPLSHSHAQIRETDVRDYYFAPAQRAGKQVSPPIPLSPRRLVRRAR